MRENEKERKTQDATVLALEESQMSPNPIFQLMDNLTPATLPVSVQLSA